jgi:hypothetical protein
MALLETLVDDFNLGFQSGLWTKNGDASKINVTQNQLVMQCAEGGGNNYLTSVSTAYDSTGSYAYLQVPDFGDQAIASFGFYFWVYLDFNNTVRYLVQGGNLVAQKVVAGSGGPISSIALDRNAHKWLRLREAAGVTYWDYSSDGQSWVNQTSLANPITMTAVGILLQCTSGAETKAPQVIIDNFNTLDRSPYSYRRPSTGWVKPMSLRKGRRYDIRRFFDQVAPPVDNVITQDDPVGVLDGITVDVGTTQLDTVGLLDTTTLDVGKTQTDPVGISDSITVDVTRSQSDLVGILDAVTLDVGRTQSDTVGVGDSVTLARESAVTDPVGVSDSQAKDAGRTVVDAVGVVDSLAAGVGRAPVDPVGIVDALSTIQDVIRAPVDAVGVLDSVSLGTGRTVTDPVGVTDSVTAELVEIEPPVVVGYAVGAAASGNSIVFNKSDLPTMLDGDYLVAMVRCSTSAASTLYSCTGFTLLAPASYTVDAGGRLIGAHGHVVTTAGSEPSTYTFAFTGTGGRHSGVLLLVRGVDITNPVSGYANGGTTYYNHGSFASGWTTAVGSLILAAAANEVVSPNSSTPTSVDSDYTTVAVQPHTSGTGVTRTVVWVGSKTAASATAPSSSGTVWASSSSLAYWSLSLTGLPVAVEDIPGFPNVTSALAFHGATMAHRGASGVSGMPEMSERGYDYAVDQGYGILEFSANRTSDGVWVGCHDADLNRTSETSGLPAISTQTWATVQTFQNTLNDGGTPAPYYRLVDFLDKYTPTHVVFADPKFAVGSVTDFLDTLDAHGGPTKIVVKYFGVGSGSNALADAATARGYQTWGYYYDADYGDGDMAANQSHWSILGMEYGASTAAWTAVQDYGKPVVGHIAASQANYDTAMANGADLVQCSRPDLIAAVSSQGGEARMPTDAVGIGDSVAAASGRIVTDLVGVLDTAVLDSGRALSDLVGIGDTATPVADYVRSQADVVGIADTVTVALTRTTTDPVGLLDGVALQADRTVTDLVGVGDAIAAQVTRDYTDPVGVTDSAALVAAYVRAVTDTTGIVDSVTVDLTASGAVSTTDQVGITDAVATVFDTSRAVADPVGITDAVTAALFTDVSASDLVGIVDSVTVTKDLQVSDTVGIADTVALAAARTVTDTVGVTDSVTAELYTAAGATDLVGISDTVTVVADYTRTVTDPVNLTDTTTLDSSRTVTDLVGVGDSVTAQIILTVTITDQVGILDAPQLAVDYRRTVADPVGIVDSVAAALGEIEFADQVGVTDSVRVFLFGIIGPDRTYDMVGESRTTDMVGESRTCDVVGESHTTDVIFESRTCDVVFESRDADITTESTVREMTTA